VPKDDLQAEILSKWVFEYGAKTVAIIYTNNSWGKPLTEGFEEKYTALGGKVLLHEGVIEGTSDFRTIIAKLKSLRNLDAIVAPTYPKAGAVFVRQAKQIGLAKPLFGGDPWESPEFRDKAGDAAEGIFYTGSLQRSSPTFNIFAERHKAKYGEPPDVFSAYSYDAAVAIFKAMENCRCIEGERIREALLKVSFMGVSGEIAFRPNGDLATSTFARMTIKNGVPVAAAK
jgi:branched-chain amino acid transport system substrate-binding protein